MIVRTATAADAGRLAKLHARAFPQPWTAEEIRTLIDAPGAVALTANDGFILVRAAAGEAEVLTLAVTPEARRQGLGRALLEAALRTLTTAGAEAVFLEVAADNAAALALYDAAGFAQVGRRRGYYPRPDGEAADALTLRRALSPSAA